jgi:hypothetical protein
MFACSTCTISVCIHKYAEHLHLHKYAELHVFKYVYEGANDGKWSQMCDMVRDLQLVRACSHWDHLRQLLHRNEHEGFGAGGHAQNACAQAREPLLVPQLVLHSHTATSAKTKNQ